ERPPHHPPREGPRQLPHGTGDADRRGVAALRMTPVALPSDSPSHWRKVGGRAALYLTPGAPFSPRERTWRLVERRRVAARADVPTAIHSPPNVHTARNSR